MRQSSRESSARPLPSWLGARAQSTVTVPSPLSLATKQRYNHQMGRAVEAHSPLLRCEETPLSAVSRGHARGSGSVIALKGTHNIIKRRGSAAMVSKADRRVREVKRQTISLYVLNEN